MTAAITVSMPPRGLTAPEPVPRVRRRGPPRLSRRNGLSSSSGANTSRANDGEAQRRYQEQGFGDRRIGFGRRPALLIVDMQNDFVDEDAPSTCSPIARRSLPAFQRLLDRARATRIPVLFSQGIVGRDLADVGLWKSRPHRDGRVQLEGTRGAEIVDELKPLSTEHVIRKRRPSAFFATDLDMLLRSYSVDTILLAGSSMSGCVRATAVDAFSRDYRTVIVRECVVDRTQALIDNNLFDVDAKYADAISVDEALAYLRGVAGATEAAKLASVSGGSQ